MTGALSYRLLWLSLSFAFVTVCLLYTDFFLDFNQDKAAGKKTIPILTGSKQNAYYFYIFIIFMIYALIFVGIHSHLFPLKYAIIFLSVIPALGTVKRLQHYIDKEIKDRKRVFKRNEQRAKVCGNICNSMHCELFLIIWFRKSFFEDSCIWGNRCQGHLLPHEFHQNS